MVPFSSLSTGTLTGSAAAVTAAHHAATLTLAKIHLLMAPSCGLGGAAPVGREAGLPASAGDLSWFAPARAGRLSPRKRGAPLMSACDAIFTLAPRQKNACSPVRTPGDASVGRSAGEHAAKR